MNDAERKRIAAGFRGHWDRNYALAKLRSDPLYEALTAQLRGSDLPLLDLGCGIGLLAHFLRSEGLEMPIHGVDYDPRKIESAMRTIDSSGIRGVSFASLDLRAGLPAHSGNVAILDILQFFAPGEQETLLEEAASRVAPGGKLIIRSGLRDDSWRFKLTVLGDWLAKATLWMKAGPDHYPTADDFRSILAPSGEVTISPLWGSTPFNNHLVVMKRPPEN